MTISKTVCLFIGFIPGLVFAQNSPKNHPDAVSIPIRIGSPEAVSETVSIGDPDRGALAYGVALEAGKHLAVRKGRNFGTVELVGLIEAAASRVNDLHPGTERLYVGDLSLENGGRMRPHVSHQSGLDADIGYYLKRGHASDRLKGTSAKNLDVARTYTFIETLLESGDVQYIFSDTAIIDALRRHAQQTVKLAPKRVAEWFGGRGQKSAVRHLKGHASHLHLRVRGRVSKGTLAQVAEGALRAKLRSTMHPVAVNDLGTHAPEPTIIPTLQEKRSSSTPVSDPAVVVATKAPIVTKPGSSLHEISLAIGNHGRRQRNPARARVSTAQLRAHLARARARKVRDRLKLRRNARRQGLVAIPKMAATDAVSEPPLVAQK